MTSVPVDGVSDPEFLSPASPSPILPSFPVQLLPSLSYQLYTTRDLPRLGGAVNDRDPVTGVDGTRATTRRKWGRGGERAAR